MSRVSNSSGLDHLQSSRKFDSQGHNHRRSVQQSRSNSDFMSGDIFFFKRPTPRPHIPKIEPESEIQAPDENSGPKSPHKLQISHLDSQNVQKESVALIYNKIESGLPPAPPKQPGRPKK